MNRKETNRINEQKSDSSDSLCRSSPPSLSSSCMPSLFSSAPSLFPSVAALLFSLFLSAFPPVSSASGSGSAVSSFIHSFFLSFLLRDLERLSICVRFCTSREGNAGTRSVPSSGRSCVRSTGSIPPERIKESPIFSSSA